MNTTFQAVVESFERADQAAKERVEKLERDLAQARETITLCSDLQKQLAQARETIARLNRRAQVAEAAVNENLEAFQKAGVSFTRELANAGYHIVKRERDRLLEALEPLAKAKVEVVKLGVEDVVFIGLEGECSVVVKHFQTAQRVAKEMKDGR